MVAEEHFGGFLTKRSDEGDEGPKKSWKERMEEIITKSKREKVGGLCYKSLMGKCVKSL